MSGGCVANSVVYQKIPGGIYLPENPTFDLKQIMDSGQCFRIRETNGVYSVVTGTYFVRIGRPRRGGYLFYDCSEDAFQHIWIPYFDFFTNYAEYQQKMVKDSFLAEAIQHYGGIRILCQDPWEMVVSFVISQRNNIPRIRNCVERLCKRYGSLIAWESEEHPIFSFPTPDQLRGKDLSDLGLGYRAKYIEDLAYYNNEAAWQCMKDVCSADEIKEILLRQKGIGEKVANCIMLFGYHHMDSYPRDVWINRMIEDVYQGSFDPQEYKGFAGYVQQLQFAYYRSLQGEVKK